MQLLQNHIKYFYDYIITNTDYVLTAENNQEMISVMENGQSVCQGYAKTFQYLMRSVGLQSILVTGYSNKEAHAWNIVMADGNWYHIDCTWGDTSSKNGNAINYDYFCVNDAELEKTHIIQNVIPPPACTHTENNYYVHEGLYFDDLDDIDYKEIFNKAYKNHEKCVTLKFANSLLYARASMSLIDCGEVLDYYHNSSAENVMYVKNDKQNILRFYLEELTEEEIEELNKEIEENIDETEK